MYDNNDLFLHWNCKTRLTNLATVYQNSTQKMQRSKAPIKIYSNTPIKNGSKDQDEFLHDMQMLQDPTDALFAAEEAFLREHDGIV